MFPPSGPYPFYSVSAQQLQHAALGTCADGLTNQLTVLEQQQGGDAHDAELGGQIGLLVSTSASKFSFVMVMTAISFSSIKSVFSSDRDSIPQTPAFFREQVT